MKKKTTDTKRLTLLALLTAAALVLGYVEHLIPLTAIPGIKLGLANTVLLYALFLMDVKSAVLLMLLKVGLSGLLYGGVSAMAYSFAGGALSLLGMCLVKRIPGMSVIGVSVTGAALHNIGQVLLACLVVGSRAVLVYLPLLLVSAAATGVLTGIVARLTMRALKRYHKKDADMPQEPKNAP